MVLAKISFVLWGLAPEREFTVPPRPIRATVARDRGPLAAPPPPLPPARRLVPLAASLPS